MEHGRNTANLGRKLRKRIETQSNKDVRVFYDHGRKGESKRVVPYFDDYNSSTTMAFVDIAIANTRAAKILLLCEVEEEGASPKKIVGDCMNVYLADFVCIGRMRYALDGVHLIIGVKTPYRGGSRKKTSDVLNRIQVALKDNQRREITLEPVFSEDNESLVSILEDRILEIVGLSCRN